MTPVAFSDSLYIPTYWVVRPPGIEHVFKHGCNVLSENINLG